MTKSYFGNQKEVGFDPEKQKDFNIAIAGFGMKLGKDQHDAWRKFYMTIHKDKFDIFIKCLENHAKETEYKALRVPVVRSRFYGRSDPIRSDNALKTEITIHDEYHHLIKETTLLEEMYSKYNKKDLDEYVYLALGIMKHDIALKKEKAIELQQLGADQKQATNLDIVCNYCSNSGYVYCVIGGPSAKFAKPLDRFKENNQYFYCMVQPVPCNCHKGKHILDNSNIFSDNPDAYLKLLKKCCFKRQHHAEEFRKKSIKVVGYV